eukprot:gene6130-6750_t
MAALTHEYESDLSDEEVGGQELSAWLDEADPDEDEPSTPTAPITTPQPKIDIIHKSEYIVQNLDLFYALCEVEDWEFENLPDGQQEDLMKTLVVEEYQPGECIIVEGDTGNDLYIIVATEQTAHQAEVEVVNQNILAGTEVFLTRLHRGQFFGQKFFVTRRVNKRGATVRVPYDSPIDVQVAKLSMEYFDKWESFRNLLLVKTVPLVQKLPRKERSKILQNLQIREFKDGDYIIKQGEKGEDFFIIQEGSVKVVETRPSPDKGWEAPVDVVLVTLREGHFFGEMSLSVFRAALSDETFHEVLSEVLSKRKEIRKQREKEQQEEKELLQQQLSFSASSTSSSSNPFTQPLRRGFSRRASATSTTSEVTVSSTLLMRKLESGSKVINKYIVERELGKGSFGEVYLCRDQDTNELYAMKQITRPQTGWNDEASNAIRQEIAVMKRLKHENVVGLHEVIDDQNARKIFLIQEYMEGGALMDDAETCDPLEINLARKYFRDILRGVCYLHSEGIIHRDIKPQNMLKSADGTVKIADFGAAVFTGVQQKVAFGGTPAFMAPELFLTNKDSRDFTKSPGIDVFALGATLYYMVVGRPPWMARNQIDLARMIKNIELVFPNDNIDPHLKHLLRQMLAKDYRLRCNLDTIVVDDWVTFEGSEPLFEKDPYLIQEYTDFETVLIEEDPTGPPPLHILLVCPSLVIRTMLHQQINNVTAAVCVCASNGEEAMHIIRSAMESHPQENFDYIFSELLLPTKRDGLAAMKFIRKSGFKGKIIGMTTSNEDMDDFLTEEGADAVVRRPIANRELSLLLAKEEFEEIADTMLHKTHGAPPVDKITAEEFDNAITFNAASRSHSMRTMSFSDNSSPVSAVEKNAIANEDNDELDNENDVQDFDNCSSSASTSHRNLLHEAHLTQRRSGTDSPDVDMSRLNLLEKGGLVRKRAFMVVPYGADIPQAKTDPTVIFDRPLKILGLKEEGGHRRERREQAMRHSKLALQYRLAKKEGDMQKVSSSKSLLNLMKSQSKRSFQHSRHHLHDSSQSSNDGFNSSIGDLSSVGNGHGSSQQAMMIPQVGQSNHSLVERGDSPLTTSGKVRGSSPTGAPPATLVHSSSSSMGGGGPVISVQNSSPQTLQQICSSHNLHNVSMRNIDLFIGNTVEEGPEIENDSEDDNLEDTDPEEESILDDSSDDDDFGIDADEIKQLDDDAFEEEFSKLIRKKSDNDNSQEVSEWNHTLVGVDLREMLKRLPEKYNPQLRVVYGMAESVVSRSYMEDRSYGAAMHPGREEEHRPSLAMFAVFDGHNGDYVAAALKEKYATKFLELLKNYEDGHKLGHSRPGGFESNHYESRINHIFEETNACLDREILDKDYVRQQKSVHSGIQDMQTYAGSVAVVAAILPAYHPAPPPTPVNLHHHQSHYQGVHVFISHVGDCRAVLSHDGIAVQLTEDHKANLKTEKTRIENAGGWVHNGRVNGALGVSRSFGDIQFKNYEACLNHCGDETESRGIWGMHQQVVSKPDFKHFMVEDSYEFMILASDGLWDVFSCQEAVNFVRKRLLVNNDVQETAQQLIDKAIERGTQDNTSVIVVAFNQ